MIGFQALAAVIPPSLAVKNASNFRLHEDLEQPGHYVLCDAVDQRHHEASSTH